MSQTKTMLKHAISFGDFLITFKHKNHLYVLLETRCLAVLDLFFSYLVVIVYIQSIKMCNILLLSIRILLLFAPFSRCRTLPCLFCMCSVSKLYPRSYRSMFKQIILEFEHKSYDGFFFCSKSVFYYEFSLFSFMSMHCAADFV